MVVQRRSSRVSGGDAAAGTKETGARRRDARRRSSRDAPAERAPEKRETRGAQDAVSAARGAVPLRGDDAEKLRVVVADMLPTLLDRRSGVVGAPFPTLREALAPGRTLDLRELWDHAMALRSASCGDAVRVDAAACADVPVAILQHLLAELARAAPVASDWPLYAADAPVNAPYALHMRLPAGDYFSNAAAMPAERAASLDTGHANLVAVPPPVVLHGAPETVPTLGERVPTWAREAKASRADSVHPAVFLSYGQHTASFAPSYDTTDRTLSAQQTDECYVAHSRTAARLRHRWGPLAAERYLKACGEDVSDGEGGDERDGGWRGEGDAGDAGKAGGARTAEMAAQESAAAAAYPPLPEAAASPPCASPHLPPPDIAALAASAAALDPGLDAGVLQDAVRSLEFDDALRANAEMLEELQALQWVRTRAEYGTPHAAPLQRLRVYEQRVAERVLYSLALLLARAPRNTLTTAHAHRVRPLAHACVAALSTALDAPDTQPLLARGFWGTIPQGYHGARSHALLPTPNAPGSKGPAARPSVWAPLVQPSAVADNTTVHWTGRERSGALAAAAAEFAGSPAEAVLAAGPRAQVPYGSVPPGASASPAGAKPAYGFPMMPYHAPGRTGLPVVRPAAPYLGGGGWAGARG
ncbi:hypothetical protein MSPP1_002245 [Malassezia sp. CBS 17886]|nr:hypothetical protein MSPP1_002245 [Malassezia sp. CBS 17886]